MSGWALPGWHDDAACNTATQTRDDMGLAWVHDEDGATTQEAKDICASCPVRRLCLQDAVDDPNAQGIRGGYRFHYGRAVSRDDLNSMRAEGIRVPADAAPYIRRPKKESGAWPSG